MLWGVRLLCHQGRWCWSSYKVFRDWMFWRMLKDIAEGFSPYHGQKYFYLEFPMQPVENQPCTPSAPIPLTTPCFNSWDSWAGKLGRLMVESSCPTTSNTWSVHFLKSSHALPLVSHSLLAPQKVARNGKLYQRNFWLAGGSKAPRITKVHRFNYTMYRWFLTSRPRRFFSHCFPWFLGEGVFLLVFIFQCVR